MNKYSNNDNTANGTFVTNLETRKELNVKTPINAIEKWFEIEPEIFMENPL